MIKYNLTPYAHEKMKTSLIAPCGMNCALCRAYLINRRRCPGCRGRDDGKPETCVRCVIKNCARLKKNHERFCSERCPQFPCDRLVSLDKRYRTKYGMSMIENLGFISARGIHAFIRKEKRKWIKGARVFCVHTKTYCAGNRTGKGRAS